MKYVVTVGMPGYVPYVTDVASTLSEAFLFAKEEKRRFIEDDWPNTRVEGNIRRDWWYTVLTKKETDAWEYTDYVAINLAEEE